jgi:hypothetical protein
MMICVWVMFLIVSCSSPAVALEPTSILVGFSVADGQWIVPPDQFADRIPPGFDMEVDLERNNGRVLTVRIDLDGDGAPDYFVQNASTCGKGGCPYAVFDGRSKRLLGEVFGSEVWVLRERSNGMAILESFSYVSAYHGVVVRYQFNGSSYKDVFSRDIYGEEIETLVKELHSAPRVGFP